MRSIEAAIPIQIAAAFIKLTLIRGLWRNVFVHSIPKSKRINEIAPQKMERIAKDRSTIWTAEREKTGRKKLSH